MKSLTSEQVESYRCNGFLFPVPALTPEEIATCLAGLGRLERELGSTVADADIKWRSHAYAHSPWFNDLIRHPQILDAVEDLIGSDILVWTSTFFIKEPRSPTFAAWHQDATYFGLEPKESVCAWVALTDASQEAGCMEALSSRGAPRQLSHAALRLENSINRAGQTITETLDQSNPVVMSLPAGSFSLHHELAVHRSAPNNASHRRHRVELHASARAGGWPAPPESNAGARQGHLRAFRPDRPAVSGARRTCACRAQPGKRGLQQELQRAGEEARTGIRQGWRRMTLLLAVTQPWIFCRYLAERVCRKN